MLEKLYTFTKTPNFKKLALTAFVVILAVLISFLIFIKKMSYSLIENNLSNFLGLKIELINPKTGINFNLNITSKAQYINIYDIKKTKKYISIKNPYIEVKLFSVLFKKINIKNLTAEDIQIKASANEKGEIDILKSLNLENLKKINIQKYNTTRFNAQINNIEAIFDDNNKNSAKINLKNTDIVFSKKNKELKIKQKGTIEAISSSCKNTSNIFVDIDSNFPIEDTKNKNSKFEIKIDNLNLELLSGLFKEYISKEITAVSGKTDLLVTKDKEKNCNKLTLQINKPTLFLKNKKIISPYGLVDLEMFFNINKDNLELQDLNLLSNNLNVNTKGEITKIFSKKPNINLKTKIVNTQLNNFVYFIPDNLIFYRPKGIPTLKNSNFYAVLNGNVDLKLFPLNITGNLKASDIHIPNYPKPSQPNDVNAIFMENKMRIYTRIYTPQNEYVTIDGISNLDDSLFGQYSVKSTQKIDLAYAKMYLVPVQQIIGFNVGPLPIMDIKGTGNIDIKTKGTIFDAQIFGTFNAQNASAKIDGLDANLTNGNCVLVFDNRTLIFKEIKGKLDGANFTLKGTGNTKGEVNLTSSIKNIKTSKLLKIFNNSTVSERFKFLTQNIAATSGNSNAEINLKGTIKNYETKDFLNDLILSGKLELINNKIILQNKLQAKNIKGILEFGENQSANLNLSLYDSKINVNFLSKTPLEKIINKEPLLIKSEISSNDLKSKDIINTIANSNVLSKTKKELLLQFEKLNFSTKFNIKSTGKISLNDMNFANLKNDGYIVGLNEKENNVIFHSGLIKLSQNKLFFDNLELGLLDGKIKFNGNITNYLDKNPQNNFFISLKNINLETLTPVAQKMKLKNAILNNGLVIAKNNEIKLNSFNFNYQTIPVFLNAQIKNIYGKKSMQANFSTILTEQTTDNTINTFLVTPIKIKNEVPIKGNFSGQSDNYTIDFTTKIPIASDISFSGSNIGDTNYDREISGKIEVNKNSADIKNLKLVKYIKNQNKKTNAMVLLKTDGKIIQKNSELFFDNFRILTGNPTNVRILNLIFKKSLLKKGNFECNLNLNGNTKLPKATGKLLLSDLDIPLYDAEVNNIKFDLTNKIIDGEINAKNRQSDVKISLKAQNKLTLPIDIEKIDISSNKLNIKEMLENKQTDSKMSDISLKQEPIKIEDIRIAKGTINFKDVQYDKINAQNLKGDFSYKDNVFNLKSIVLDIANGNIEAKGKYNTKTSKLVLNTKMHNCEANMLTEQFLNLQNQIFGKMNGSATIDAKVVDSPESIKGIKSEIDFSVENGKMPKLGSLEYLLRAGNLIKSGIFGLSLNNLIQVLTPYKTGEFEKISGNLQIEEAKIKNLEIYSKGKNLSLFLEGEYNILENFANIRIYGKLSQNISNALGKVGNASLNQFFNMISDIADIKSQKKNKDLDKLSKIPPIENDSQTPRFFKVKVLGDINKENYIKSFNWE